MNWLRKSLISLLAGRGGASITVGSHIALNDEQTVCDTLTNRWERAGARLSPDGARLIARQINEWADTAGNATLKFVGPAA